MKRKTTKRERFTPVESVIMDCVWELSEATVKQVQERLARAKPMAYNTVLTMLRILRRKGFLASRREGRMDVYRPTVTRAQMGKHLLADLVRRFFGQSPSALVSHLLASENIGAKEMAAIRREINRKLAGDKAKTEINEFARRHR